MNILYCGDANIEQGLYLSVMSLIFNVKEELHIYVLTANLTLPEKRYEALRSENLEKLKQYMKQQNEKHTLQLIDVSDMLAENMPSANLNTRFTPLCMLRLFADEVKEIPEKILYLDNDVICRKNISEFYHKNISDLEYIGVLDYYGSWFFRKNLFRRDYVNSGVLLLNMTKIRETELFAKCRQRCQEKKMFMPDQTALNKLAVKKQFADRKYNEQRRLREDTVLQHFTTSFRFFPVLHYVTVKPWQFEEVHKKLKLYEYDHLFTEYKKLKGSQI